LWEKTLDKGTHPSDPVFVQTDENTAFILLTSVQSSTSAMWLWKLDASDGDSNWDGKSLDNLNGFDSNVPHIRLPGPVIANLDSDIAMELVVTIPSDFDENGAAYGAEYYGLEISDGTKIWDFEASNGYADSAPIVIDTDGDGAHDRVCWITWTVSGILETNFDGFAGCHDGTDGSNPQQSWSIEILEPQGAFNDGIAVSSPIWLVVTIISRY
jgi:outer membrane protein assembly factor BamB